MSKIITIGSWNKGGMPIGWSFDYNGQPFVEYLVKVDEDGRVLVGGIEIIEWTEARKSAMEKKDKEALMSEENLCWGCREYIISKYGSSAYFPPFQHCHHEPKEKSKCWCGDEEIVINSRSITYSICGSAVQINFCPECGRKL